VIRRADIALYAAKSTGRDRVEFYEPSMGAANDALTDSLLKRA
jgi:predicted signal transduction protein with EAL and GGDEF domain